MLTDSDMAFAGFSWRSYFSKILENGSLVTSTLRESVEEGIKDSITEPKRLWYQIFNSPVWKDKKDKNFLNNCMIETDFIEQYFVTLDGPFASWFLKKILADEFMVGSLNGDNNVEIVSSWGPDLMWCGAAEEYIKLQQQRHPTEHAQQRKGCMVSMMNMEHLDTRQIDHKRGDGGIDGATAKKEVSERASER